MGGSGAGRLVAVVSRKSRWQGCNAAAATAPRCMPTRSVAAASLCPCSAALHSGVQPSAALLSTRALAASSARITAVWPSAAAACNAVLPRAPLALGGVPPLSSRLMVLRSPWAAAFVSCTPADMVCVCVVVVVVCGGWGSWREGCRKEECTLNGQLFH